MNRTSISGEKDRMTRKAEQNAIRNAKQQAMDTLKELQTLEKQREMIMGKLQLAQDNVVKFVQPEADPEDMAQLAKVPETPEEELDTLGMISHKMSLIIIFGHKHFRQKFHQKFDIFHEKISTASDFGSYLVSNFKF